MNRATESLPDRLTRPWLLAGLLAVATFALFSPAIGYGFINYDDNRYLFDNPHIAHGWGLDAIAYAFRTTDGAIWMPLTWLSYFLDTALWGTRPAGYHLTNILLHSASAGLLFLVWQKMTQQTWAALAVAALFAFHPQRLESVAWVAERKDVLSLFFCLLGLLAYARYAEKPGAGRMAWVAVCLLLGVMAKPMVISFPLIILLLDFWPLHRFGHSRAERRARAWPLVREKLPLFLIAAAAGVVAVWSQHRQGGVTPAHFPWHLHTCRVIENVWYYLQAFFVPAGLAIVHRVNPLDYWHVGLAAGVLGLITLGALLRAAGQPWLLVGWGWFLCALGPVAGWIRVGEITVADRYSYLPSVGLAVAVVFSAAELAAHHRRVRGWLSAGLAAWVLVCGADTRANLPAWRNNFTVFENAFRHGAHFVACDQLGSELYARGDYQDSIQVCSRGLADNPDFAALYNTRGGDYYMLGDLDRAMADYERAIAANPDFPPTYYGRALIHIQRKQLAEAQADLRAYREHGGRLDTSHLIPAP